MATWKKVLLEGGVTGTAPIDVTDEVVSLDLKTNGGLVVESDELAVDLSASAITGTLAVGNGGTGLSSVAQYSVLVANTANTLEVATAATDGHVLTYDTTNGIQWEALPAASNAFSIISPGSGDALQADAAGDTLNINGTRGITVTGSNSGDTDTLVISMDFAGLSGGALDESTIAAGDLFILEDIDESTVANKQKRITAANLQDFILGGDNLVTTISGTTNQITASASTGDVTLSIPSTFIAPGSIQSTSTITADTGLTVSAGGASITGNTTISGDLTVTGTTTTIQTQNVLVEDKLIVLGNPDTDYTTDANAVAGATGGGISVLSDTSGSEGDYAAVMWNNNHLTGWEVGDASSVSSDGNKHPIAIMDFVLNSASAPTVDSAGVGSFFFAQANATSDGDLYVRVQ